MSHESISSTGYFGANQRVPATYAPFDLRLSMNECAFDSKRIGNTAEIRRKVRALTNRACVSDGDWRDALNVNLMASVQIRSAIQRDQS
jgi:hypothetical protein